jgi:hypothetical protein
VVGVRLAVLVAVLATSPALAQAPFAIPPGWERPLRSDLDPGSYDFGLRKAPDLNLIARGDFNGDGKPDQAELLVNRPAASFALFIHLAGEAVPREISRRKLSQLAGVGIGALKPGTYRTICGRHVPIGPTCPEAQVATRTDTVSYANFEASSYFLTWKDDRFEEVWTSD